MFRKFQLTVFIAVSPVYALALDIFEEPSNLAAFITPVTASESEHASQDSITRLDKELLNALGIDSVVDAMRMVPGMVVNEIHGNTVSLDYHGGNSFRTRRTQLLFNSKKLSRPVDDNILWNRLPVEIEDISFVEVARGTSVTTYGSNSFLSAVNLVQDPAAIQPDLRLQTSYSEIESRNFASLAFDLGESVNYLRFASERTKGYDFSPQTNNLADGSEGFSGLYNAEMGLGNGLLDWLVVARRHEYDFPTLDVLENENPDAQLEISGISYPERSIEKGYYSTVRYSGASKDLANAWQTSIAISGQDREQPLTFSFPAFFYDTRLAALDAGNNISITSVDFPLIFGSSLQTGTAQLNESILGPLTAEQNQLLQEFGQLVQSRGLEAITQPLIGQTNQNIREQRSTINGVYNYTPKQTPITLKAELTFHHNKVESATFLNGSHTRNNGELKLNASYSIENTKFYFGTLIEDNSDIKRTYASTSFSAAHQSGNHIYRTKIAQSKRLPSVWETNLRWQFLVDFENGDTDLDGNSQGRTLRLSEQNDLTPENIVVRELEYIYTIGRSSLNIKVFDENRYDLISQPLSYIVNNYTNNGRANIRGIEGSFSTEYRDFRFGGSFTNLDTDSGTLEETTLVYKNSGSLWGIYQISENSSIGGLYFGNSRIADNAYDRYDLNYRHSTSLGSAFLTFNANARYYPEKNSAFTQFSPTTPLVTGYDERTRLTLALSVEF